MLIFTSAIGAALHGNLLHMCTYAIASNNNGCGLITPTCAKDKFQSFCLSLWSVAKMHVSGDSL